jgi:hypothetical protein
MSTDATESTMSLSHEIAASRFSIDEDDEDNGGGEDLAMALTRDELQGMASKVTELYENAKTDASDRKKLAEAVYHLVEHDKARQEAQARNEGRFHEIEKTLGIRSVAKHHSDPAELGKFETTQAGEVVKIPVYRAGQLLDAEREKQDLSAMLARYRWWTGTFREMGWGAAKLAGKFFGTLALGWMAREVYVLWTHR